MKNDKWFTLPKVGYTAGVYGCSNEYFHLIAFDGERVHNYTLAGMYGAEDRVAQALKDKGYTELYTNSVWGKLTRNDIPKKLVQSEYDLLETIKTF